VAAQAACAAVWVHGTAGDLFAIPHGHTSLTASALAQQLPDAFHMLIKGFD
jgi:NAD(P)H-hydrate repair Nnr-like enzyme with NAD(P)H-hydrate dehydratase domain